MKKKTFVYFPFSLRNPSTFTHRRPPQTSRQTGNSLTPIELQNVDQREQRPVSLHFLRKRGDGFALVVLQNRLFAKLRLGAKAVSPVQNAVDFGREPRQNKWKKGFDLIAFGRVQSD